MLEKFRSRFYVTLTGYLALLAMIFGMLLPGISQAVVPFLQNDSLQVEVCTSSGIKYISFDIDIKSQSSDDKPTSFKSHHCDYCGVTGYAYLAPTLQVLWLPEIPKKSFGYALAQTYPRPSLGWQPANPRAPPLHT